MRPIVRLSVLCVLLEGLAATVVLGQDTRAAAIAEAQANAKYLKEEVDAEDIAEIVARWTGIPVSRMLESERERLTKLEGELAQRVVGQDVAVTAVANGRG